MPPINFPSALVYVWESDCVFSHFLNLTEITKRERERERERESERARERESERDREKTGGRSRVS